MADRIGHLQSDSPLSHSDSSHSDVTAPHHTVENAIYWQVFHDNQAIKLLIDPNNGKIMDANPNAVQFYGYSLEQLRQLTIMHINILSEAEIRTEMERARTHNRGFFEFRHRLASGEIRDVDVFSSPIEINGQQYLYSIIIDVTGKRSAEFSYLALFEQSNDGVVITDLARNILQANRRACDLLGYSLEELSHLSLQDLIIAEELDASTELIRRILDGETVPPTERTLRHKNGSLVFTEINSEVVRNTQGQAHHIQSIIRDISQRKQAVEQELELRLQKERVKLLGNFFRDAAHEFRTPLAIISSSAYLIGRTCNKPDIQPRIEKIEYQVKQISHLVDSLALLMKLESHQTLEIETLRLNEILHDLCQRQCQESQQQAKLTCKIDERALVILGNQEQLEIAFRELLMNACHFTPADGSINISAKVEGTNIIVQVLDTGVGIAEENLAHIFDIFWRQEFNTVRGFGLGLPIVQRIIQRHGGTVQVFSHSDQGTCVEVRLPLWQEPLSPAKLET